MLGEETVAEWVHDAPSVLLCLVHGFGSGISTATTLPTLQLPRRPNPPSLLFGDGGEGLDRIGFFEHHGLVEFTAFDRESREQSKWR